LDNFINLIFSEVNIILSVLLILLVIYWVLTSLTGIDFDYDLDIDIDVDIDADLDLDINTVDPGSMDFEDISSAEVDKTHVVNKRRKPLKWWQVFLIYFNFVGLPFMFTFTAWVFLWWLSTLVSTSITGSYANSFGYILMFICMVPALFFTKILTTPFKSFFRHLNKDGDKATDFLGRNAILLSSISGDKMGNAEVLADGNPMSIYVKSLDGSELRFRESVLIIKQSADKNYFLVSKY